jgi:hypothetical protein
LAVSFAATVLVDACRKGGCNAALAIHNSEAECIAGPASSAMLQNLMERLAVAEAHSDDTLPALLPIALRQIPAGAEIVLITTRPVDLSDGRRFAEIAEDPALAERVSHLLCVDASSDALAKYFVAE